MKLIDVLAEPDYLAAIKTLAEKQEIAETWFGPMGEDGRQSIRLLVDAEKTQAALDALQAILGNSETGKILVTQVEAALPREEEKKEKTPEEKKETVATTREELYHDIEKNARLNGIYLFLVFLSTVVVAIGLLKNNVTVVIGAMVIAPLLGPNIALALGTALGDGSLMLKATKTATAGLGCTVALSYILGLVWQGSLDSGELLARTVVGLDSVALAFASGAAAVLSLTTGLASVLVGVMVAVALMPPTATLGIMLGAGQMELAYGAALLLAVNIVCVNLAANLTFLARGIKPRTWLEKQKAKQSMALYITIWLVSLAILIAAITLR